MADRVDDHMAGTTTLTQPLGTTREQMIDLRRFCIDRAVAVATLSGVECSDGVISIAGQIESYVLNGAPPVTTEHRERLAERVAERSGLSEPRRRFSL